MIYTITNKDVLDWKAKKHNRILQNIVNLLNLSMYEVPYDRTRGIDWSVIDKPFLVAVPLLKNDIRETIAEYEPRAKIIDVDIISSTQENIYNGNFTIKVVVEID